MDVKIIGPPNLHDATIQCVVKDNDLVRVYTKTPDGRVFRFEFRDVQSIHQNHPEGMVLYSLSELEESSPYRRFCFTNWDEEDKSSLEIVARDVVFYDANDQSP